MREAACKVTTIDLIQGIPAHGTDFVGSSGAHQCAKTLKVEVMSTWGLAGVCQVLLTDCTHILTTPDIARGGTRELSVHLLIDAAVERKIIVSKYS